MIAKTPDLAAWESLAGPQTLLSVATRANESAEHLYAKGAADIQELLTSRAARSDAALESIHQGSHPVA